MELARNSSPSVKMKSESLELTPVKLFTVVKSVALLLVPVELTLARRMESAEVKLTITIAK